MVPGVLLVVIVTYGVVPSPTVVPVVDAVVPDVAEVVTGVVLLLKQAWILKISIGVSSSVSVTLVTTTMTL